ncbi:2233_t:CDS:2 [Ambispora leptoticha]|uniref:2233_t:CDS:1 n=1 Tax=Ambispora leptoticha TaxID=144679 RepID=A0A9N8VDH6_9GLOM|nr:2233_t:CDS:2 [Ambispora leptoticha]
MSSSRNLRKFEKAESLYPSLDPILHSNKRKITYTGTPSSFIAYQPPRSSRKKIGVKRSNEKEPYSIPFWRRESSWLLIYLLLFVLYITLYWWPNIKLGFCNNGEYKSEDFSYYIGVSCTNCPPHAICSNGKLIGCDYGYKIDMSHPLLQSLYPTSQRCVHDKQQPQRVREIVDIIDNTLSSEAGKLECKGVTGENKFNLNILKILLEKRMRFQESDWQKAIEILNKTRDGVDFFEERNQMYLKSKHPKPPLYCIIYNSAVWARTYYTRRRREKNEDQEYVRQMARYLYGCLNQNSKEGRPLILFEANQNCFDHYGLPTNRFNRIWPRAVQELKTFPNVQERYFGEDLGFVLLAE